MASLLFVRHGRTRYSGQSPLNKPLPSQEMLAPLLVSELEHIFSLRSLLAEQGFKPQFLLTSAWVHARQSAEALANGEVPTADVTALTPHTVETKFTVDNVRDEGALAGINWSTVDCVALVGHEPRLSILARRMTRQEIERLPRLAAGVAEGESLGDILAGATTVTWRIIRPSL